MHLRTLTAALVAFLLALAPTSAFAYGEDSGSVRTTESNPAPGEVFGVVVEAAACPTVRLEVDAPAGATTIDGEQTNTASKPAVDGEATFEVAIAEEGEYRLTGYCDTTDEVLGVQMVVVGDAGAGAGGDTDEAVAGGGTTGGGLLPATGADLTTTLVAGGGLLLLAAGGVILLRRRSTTTA